MRIVVVNRFYKPDFSATSQLLTELAESLAADGHEITIVTSRLGYVDTTTDLPGREQMNGVDVIRVPSTRLGRAGVPGRMVDYITFYLSAIFVLFQQVRKGDVLITKTDPPMISVAGALVANIKGARLINWCQDLFPEVAGSLGMGWAKGPIGKALTWLRNRSLKSADMNAVLDENMKDHLIAQGVPEKTIRILPNWCDARITPVRREDNPLREEWGLKEKVVIGYSGNLGRAHVPPKIAELLKRTSDLSDVVWLFIGGGKGSEEVQYAAAQCPEGKIVFKGYQPLERLSESLSVADIHLISLEPECEGLIMPSKYYGVLAVDRPILFLGSPEGTIAKDIKEMGHGAILDIDQPDSWRAIVEECVENPRALQGKASPSLGHAGLGRWREALRTFE